MEPLRKQQAIKAAEDAAREAAEAAEAARQAELARQADLAATTARMAPFGTYGNNYDWGNCTAYVASRISVPNSMGNATSWSWGLASAGWRSGEPRSGAIGVSHLGWAGHVVIAEQVSGGNVLISEMNFYGLDVIDTRWVSALDFQWFF